MVSDRKVGIATVDRLIGVKQRLKADKVVLASTRKFTNIAKKAAAELHTEIVLVDRYGLADWVEQYLLPSEEGALRLPSIPVQALGDPSGRLLCNLCTWCRTHCIATPGRRTTVEES